MILAIIALISSDCEFAVTISSLALLAASFKAAVASAIDAIAAA